MKRTGRGALVLLVLVALSGCGGDAHHPSFLARVGLADPPPPQTITIDVAFDPSKDSSCTPEALDATLAATLPVIADRPGSDLRLWLIGPDLASTKLIAPVKGTVSITGNAATVRAAKARFVDGTRASLMTAAQPYLIAPAKGGSPIAESITMIAAAGVHTDLRILCVVSDARQVSTIGGDFECDDPLPNAGRFVKTLQRERVLPPGSFAGVKVFFTFMTITPIHRKGCAETLDRLSQMQTLWTAAIEAAGGTAQFDTGAIDTTAIVPKQKGDA
jgi:hypothetical protein